jgi:hypothetical protein
LEGFCSTIELHPRLGGGLTARRGWHIARMRRAVNRDAAAVEIVRDYAPPKHALKTRFDASSTHRW